jgi:hypothetical protein
LGPKPVRDAIDKIKQAGGNSPLGGDVTSTLWEAILKWLFQNPECHFFDLSRRQPGRAANGFWTHTMSRPWTENQETIFIAVKYMEGTSDYDRNWQTGRDSLSDMVQRQVIFDMDRAKERYGPEYQGRYPLTGILAIGKKVKLFRFDHDSRTMKDWFESEAIITGAKKYIEEKKRYDKKWVVKGWEMNSIDPFDLEEDFMKIQAILAIS